MKISVPIYSFKKYFFQGEMDVKSFIEYCGTLKVDAVDLGYYWRDEEKEVKLVPGWLKKNSLTLAAYLGKNDFAQKGEEREKQIALIKHGIERAAQLKTKFLRVLVGDVKPEFPDYLMARAVLIDSFKNVLSLAEEKGVILALENHGKLCAKPDQILDLVGEVNSPNLKLNVDIANFVGVDEDPVTSVRKLAHLAVHAHIKDCKKGKPKTIATILGEGQVDVVGCLKTFKEVNYQGYLSLEYEVDIDNKIGVERNLYILRKLLDNMSL